ncbi:MAG TPA: ABC transporter ATP-binding protein [Armatimonadota bacterium]|nr:ABC transporter ATP-binding protein [Armatimonadota bacterium]HPO73430.1 ABC transporter ATP-binding protein [Armatimonadota bacterium]
MKSFRALARYLAPYRWAALAAPLLMALEVAMDLLQPRLLQTIVDVAIANRDLALVGRTGAIMIGAALTGAVGGIGCTIFATIAALHFGADIRGDLFRKVQALSGPDLDRLETGRLVTRLTNDVDQVQEAAAMLMRILVRAPLLVIGSFIMAVLTAPTLSLLIVAICPLAIAAFLSMTRKGHDLFVAVQDRLDRVNVALQENLAGARVVKAFVRSQREIARFGTVNEDLMETGVRASSLVAGMGPLMMLLVNLGVVAALWWGGFLVHGGKMQVGQILAFTNYLTQMLASLMMVGMLLMQLSRAGASADRILEVLETEPAVCDVPDARPGTVVTRGRIEFDNVEFSYGGAGSQPVLRGVSFVIEPGECVVILGATGSGKSTLVNLITRLYDVTAGRILVDGVDVREMRQEELRAAIGVVPQETVLFSGSVRDNIRFARPESTDAEIEEAARLAQARAFVEALPGGYDAMLGQRATSLSGGQKQRLAIARALACRPAILILDDCTSAVDATTEAEILRGLQTWDHRCTRLIVAQRASAVFLADRILILDEGKVAAFGTHEELLRTSPIYREILRSQLGEFEDAETPPLPSLQESAPCLVAGPSGEGGEA